jgi:hypothetical protein
MEGRYGGTTPLPLATLSACTLRERERAKIIDDVVVVVFGKFERER